MVGMFLTQGVEKPILSPWTQVKKNRKNVFLFVSLLCNVLRLDIETEVVVEEVEESDSDEDTIVAYKELYQLNTAVTKYTTTTTTTSHQQNIAEEEVEGIGISMIYLTLTNKIWKIDKYDK